MSKLMKSLFCMIMLAGILLGIGVSGLLIPLGEQLPTWEPATLFTVLGMGGLWLSYREFRRALVRIGAP